MTTSRTTAEPAEAEQLDIAVDLLLLADDVETATVTPEETAAQLRQLAISLCPSEAESDR